MKSKLIAPLFLATAAVISLNANAAMTESSASAYIDWSTFNVQWFDTNMGDGITAGISFSNHKLQVGAFDSFGTSDNSNQWTVDINANDGVAHGFAGSALLQSTLDSSPSGPSAYAYATKFADFTVAANTIVTFTVFARTSINLPMPNGDAYAWSTLDVEGTFGDTQHGTASKLSRAAGIGNTVTDSGLMTAYFVNLTDNAVTGKLSAGTSVNSYGLVSAVPEPETYAMLLAGLGLMGFIARRRMK